MDMNAHWQFRKAFEAVNKCGIFYVWDELRELDIYGNQILYVFNEDGVPFDNGSIWQ